MGALWEVFFGKWGTRQVDYHSLARGGVPQPWSSKAGWDNAGQHGGSMFRPMGHTSQKLGMDRFGNWVRQFENGFGVDGLALVWK